MSRLPERNPERTVSQVVQYWQDGLPDSEILAKMEWKSKDALYQYFYRHGYKVEDLRREAINRRIK